MSVDSSYPPSIILDGPTFNDELNRAPQQLRQQQEIASLRLIPSRSAASGVHTIYFTPEHRDWALVRLATRYRELFEIQLQRGMSGERQLMQQGFQSTDLEFLFDILPQPPDSYSPVVYDMLWLALTYPEYRYLAMHLMDADQFVPREVLESSPHLTVDDAGFFTRFVRSHFIVETDSQNISSQGQSSSSKSDLDVKLDESYTVTAQGGEVLRGIVSEYERIVEKQEFDRLLINPQADPREHLRAHTAEEEEPLEEVSLPDLEEDVEILGEIADSFAPLDDSLDAESD